MPRENVIEVEGTIVDVLKESLVRVELSNGHRMLAYIARRARSGLVRFLPGVKVNVVVSPYDLSTGRIAAREII